MGTQYTAGYGQFSDSLGAASTEVDNLIENSKYDIENGYVYLFIRLGIIGFLLFISLICILVPPIEYYVNYTNSLNQKLHLMKRNFKLLFK